MPRPSPEIVSVPYFYKQTGPDPWFPLQTAHSYEGFRRTWDGVNTPFYYVKKKTKHTVLPSNRYTSNVKHCLSQGTVRTVTRDGYGVETHEVHYLGDTPFDGLFPEIRTPAVNKATLRLYKKVDGVKVNIAQFFAERRQTADLLASTASRIYQAARALRHADARRFANALSLSRTETRDVSKQFERVYRTPPGQRITNHWLEYVYGWRPLLQDCFDIAELLGEQIATYEEPEGELRTTGLHAESFKHEPEPSIWAQGGVVLPRRNDNHICKARINVKYRLDDEARSLLNKTGISNPALLAWELLPWSFVVDWFVPVGTYLESLTAMDGFTLTSGSISTLESAVSRRWVELRRHTGFAPAYGSDFVVYERSGPETECRQTIYTRNPSTSFPYALKVKSPIGGEPLTRFATAMSLLVGLFAKPRDLRSEPRFLT